MSNTPSMIELPAASPRHAPRRAGERRRPGLRGRRRRALAASGADLDILLVTEGTYPFHFGGVSTWCHMMIQGMPQVSFHLMALTADPSTPLSFDLAPNVVSFRPVPLWGVLGPSEYDGSTRREWAERVRRTTPQAVRNGFLPGFVFYLDQLFGPELDPMVLGDAIHQLYRFLIRHDMATVARDPLVWRTFRDRLIWWMPELGLRAGLASVPFTINDLAHAFDAVMHGLFPLSTPIPKVDVVHTAMVGSCSLVAAAAQREHGVGFKLSEHGVYLRESYLSQTAMRDGLALKLVSLAFARRMTEFTYAVADQISPCCDYNQRWELLNGARHRALRTIYYGGDSDRFKPAYKAMGERPVVVWAGRINPLKDVETLIRAAAVVHAERPEIEFHLYGSASESDQPYFEKCLALRAELGLDDVVQFKGFSSNTSEVFNSGDVVVLSSISEGFPYVTLEAMLCAKPIVACGVGGIGEQIAGSGVLVEPRNGTEMGRAILDLVADPERCRALGDAALERATSIFSVELASDRHLRSYLWLASGDDTFAAKHGLGAVEAAELAGAGLDGHGSRAGRDGHASQASHANQAGPASRASHAHLAGHVVENHDDHDVLVFEPIAPANAPDALALATVVRPPSASIDDQLARELAMEVAPRLPLPVDGLEVAAVLESVGVTDVVAHRRYGARDLFDLANHVYAALRSSGGGDAARTSSKPATPDEPRGLPGASTMIAALAALAGVNVVGSLGHWASGRVSAMAVSIALAMVTVAGIAVGAARRASVYHSMQQRGALHRHLREAFGVGVVSLAIVAGVAATLSAAGLVLPHQAATVGATVIGFGVLWLLTAFGGLVKRPAVGFVVLLALQLMVVVDAVAARLTTHHVAVAALFAVGAPALLGMWFLQTAMREMYGTRIDVPIAPLWLRLAEAVPFAQYGLATMGLVLAPHVVVLLAGGTHGLDRQAARLAFEQGSLLAILPALLLLGVPERILERFWRSLGSAVHGLAATETKLLDRRIVAMLRQERRRYVVRFVAVAEAAYLAGLALVSVGVWPRAAADGGLTILAVAAISAVGFALVSYGQLNGAVCASLARPAGVARAGWLAVSCFAVLGTAGARVQLELVAVAFVAAAAVFAWASHRAVDRVLSSTDHCYLTAY